MRIIKATRKWAYLKKKYGKKPLTAEQKEYLRQYAKVYRQINKDRIREYNRRYFLEHPEYVERRNEKAKIYYAEHKEEIKIKEYEKYKKQLKENGKE